MRGVIYVLIGFVLLAAVFVAIYLYRFGGPEEQLGVPEQAREQREERVGQETLDDAGEAPQTRTEESEPREEARREAAPSAEGTQPQLDSPQAAGSVIKAMPKNQKLREEVRQDPHGTPPSLIEFSEVMAVRMEEAMQNPTQADTLYPELERCVGLEDSASAARVVCLNNARRLATRYPRFEESYSQLQARTAPEIRRLQKAMDTLSGTEGAGTQDGTQAGSGDSG